MNKDLLLKHFTMKKHWPTDEVVMPHQKMNRGIHKYGDWGTSDVEKEVRQLLTMDSIKPYNPKAITKEGQRASCG